MSQLKFSAVIDFPELSEDQFPAVFDRHFTKRVMHLITDYLHSLDPLLTEVTGSVQLTFSGSGEEPRFAL